MFIPVNLLRAAAALVDDRARVVRRQNGQTYMFYGTWNVTRFAPDGLPLDTKGRLILAMTNFKAAMGF